MTDILIYALGGATGTGTLIGVLGLLHIRSIGR